MITVSDGGSKKCQHVGPTRTHSHSHARIRCEFHFDLTNRKSFIPHTQCCPLSAFPHALQIVSSSTRFDFVNFRSLSLSLSDFRPHHAPCCQRDLCAFCIFSLCSPHNKNGPSRQVNSRVESWSMACLAGRHASIFIARLL